jgi:hypothetical protein
MASEAALVTARSLGIDAVAAEVVRCLDAAGVPSLLFKGAATARWLYGDGAPRPYDDVDLLVSPATAQAAAAALRRLGFSGEYDDDAPISYGIALHHASTWQRPGTVAPVDLHGTIAGCRASDERVWRALSSGAEAMTLAGTTVRVPGRSGRLLIVCLHAAAHGTGEPQPIEDLKRALAQTSEQEWRAAVDVARELEAEASFNAGLRLDPLGAGVASRLGLPSEVPAAVALRAGDRPYGSGALFHLRTERGLARKAAVLREALAPSADYLQANYPMARRGRMGRAAVRVLRLGRLLRHLPAASRAVRKARAHQSAEADLTQPVGRP